MYAEQIEMAITRELFQSYHHNIGAWVLLIFRDEMIKLLGLESYGLEIIRPESSCCNYGDPEDRFFIGWTDRKKIGKHLMSVHRLRAVTGLARMNKAFRSYKGGIGVLSDALVFYIKDNNGEIRFNSPVTKYLIANKFAITHKYFESTFGITDGDFTHGLIDPMQWWNKRPVGGYYDHRTPLSSLYHCGSGALPGPGVTCIPGVNTANAVLEDLGLEKVETSGI